VNIENKPVKILTNIVLKICGKNPHLDSYRKFFPWEKGQNQWGTPIPIGIPWDKATL